MRISEVIAGKRQAELAPIPPYAEKYLDSDLFLFRFSNETGVIETARALRTWTEGSHGGIFVGIVGGVDTFLTHAVNSGADRWLAIDVNPYAGLNLAFRIGLAQVSATPQEYLLHLTYNSRDRSKLPRIPEDEPHDINLHQRQLVAAFNTRYRDLPRQAFSDLIRVYMQLYGPHYFHTYKTRAETVFTEAYQTRESWLSFANPANFQRVKEIDRQGNLHFVQAPIEALATVSLLAQWQRQSDVLAVYLSDVLNHAHKGTIACTDVILKALAQVMERQSGRFVIIEGLHNHLTYLERLTKELNKYR